MMTAAKILTAIALVYIALALLAAVWVSRPREPKGYRAAGRRLFGPAGYRGPYDMPGFSREQCEAFARRPVELHHSSEEEPSTSAAGSGTPSSRRPLPLPANLNARRLFGATAPARPPFGRAGR